MTTNILSEERKREKRVKKERKGKSKKEKLAFRLIGVRVPPVP